MTNKIELPCDSTFKIDNTQYKCVESVDMCCKNCALADNEEACDLFRCWGWIRSDGKYIHFELVEED